MEISERDWLTMGFYWMAVGFLATMPPIGGSWFGAAARALFDLTIAVHIGEAIYSTTLTRRAGLKGNQWVWRALFLGYFAIRKLQPLSQTGSPPKT